MPTLVDTGSRSGTVTVEILESLDPPTAGATWPFPPSSVAITVDNDAVASSRLLAVEDVSSTEGSALVFDLTLTDSVEPGDSSPSVRVSTVPSGGDCTATAASGDYERMQARRLNLSGNGIVQDGFGAHHRRRLPRGRRSRMPQDRRTPEICPWAARQSTSRALSRTTTRCPSSRCRRPGRTKMRPPSPSRSNWTGRTTWTPSPWRMRTRGGERRSRAAIIRR